MARRAQLALGRRPAPAEREQRSVAPEPGLVAEELRVINERYRVGVATILDVVTSQIALDQAVADLVTVRYDHVVARAEIEGILGRDI